MMIFIDRIYVIVRFISIPANRFGVGSFSEDPLNWSIIYINLKKNALKM